MANPRIRRLSFTCKHCHSPFTVKRSYVNRAGHTAEYCSHAHFRAYKQSPEYFWSRVIKTETCWLWTGFLTPLGYGQIRWNRKTRSASRVAYELTHGPLLSSKIFVRHKCDNPRCVNPEHLETGTAADNSRDMTERNRQTKGTQRHNARLNEDKVRAIRREYVKGKVSLESLGIKYRVAIPTIHAVVTGSTWKHVT